jgi:hypothetical protein
VKPNLFCFLWKVCDHAFVYTVEVPTLLHALMSLIRHDASWTAFEFRALDSLLVHSDNEVQAPAMLGDQIYVYYL